MSLVPVAAYAEVGHASFYGNKFNGRSTASGEKFTQSKLTAAHKRYAFGTLVKVTNLANGKSVIVRINDRGPFVRGRVIDVSMSAAKSLGFVRAGTAKVKLELIKSGKKGKRRK